VTRWCIVPPTLLLSLSALAYEPDVATNNFAHELASCAAYYWLMSKAPKLSGEAKESSEKASFQAFSLSSELTSEKVAKARMELEVKKMMRDMDSNWSNVSVILNECAFPCKDTLEKPGERLEYWLDKED